MTLAPIPQEQAHRQPPRSGLLLINLGTPDAPTPSAIRSFLRQFLSDPRVVELPRLLWLPLLYAAILPRRPHQLTEAYASVWTDQGSPLLDISRRQHAGLALRLEGIPVALAMTYGAPSIEAGLAELETQNVRRLLVWPLYPQYSGSTTAASFDALFKALTQRRWLPELRTINSYHDEPHYIEALAGSLRRHWQQRGRGEHLLMSFHSIPRRFVESGDPYYCQCLKTARLLGESLGLREADYSVSFQSRLGNQPWLMPYSDEVIPQLAARGIRTLDVVCPGFSADCLETLEEVAIRYAGDFRAGGGEQLRYVAALNDEPAHLDALAALARRHLLGWPTTGDLADESRVQAARRQIEEPRLPE